MSFLNSSNPKLVSKYLSSFHCNIFMHEQLLCAHARKTTKNFLEKMCLYKHKNKLKFDIWKYLDIWTVLNNLVKKLLFC